MEFLNEIEYVDSTPHVGMIFETLEEAWNFWVGYGGLKGFHVRKHSKNVSKKGEITSRGFVCGNEGHRTTDKRSREVKNPRAETRTDCPVGIFLSLCRQTNKYIIYGFCGDHNHPMHQPEAVGLMPSQRKVSEPHGVIIDLADDSGIRPKEAYELMGREVGGSLNLPFSKRDHLNYLRDKRRRNLVCGEAESMMRYFSNQTSENWSFKHTEKLDNNGQITNVFWADAKMLIDYVQFGDVITFDTTYNTNKQFRPLGVFVGFNHFREIVVFGATLLYDESVDSFKWLFQTFLETHNGKYPKTIFTDQDQAMATTLKEVLPNTYHGLCTWHICQNAIKNLTKKKKNEPNPTLQGKEILKAFKACMYDYENENEFEAAFSSLLSKVRGRSEASENEVISNIDCKEHNEENVRRNRGTRESWLNFIFCVKEKWAECYMKNVHTLGMQSTQLSESFNKDLKSCLKWNMDIISFFKHFERVLLQKRDKERVSEYEMRKKLPRVKVDVPILQQAAVIYTPKIFEMFQEEWEVSIGAVIRSSNVGQLTTEFSVGVSKLDSSSNLNKCFQVIANPTDHMVSCNCNKFKRLGILCGHALKVLDVMNFKFLPENYILKRWTREARSGTVEDPNGNTIHENPKLDATRRYQALSRKLLNLAAKASDFEEVTKFVDAATDVLCKKVDEQIQNLSTDLVEQSSITFKKRNGRKGGKRLTSWVEPKRQKAKKADAPSALMLSQELQADTPSYMDLLMGEFSDALQPSSHILENASNDQVRHANFNDDFTSLCDDIEISKPIDLKSFEDL